MENNGERMKYKLLGGEEVDLDKLSDKDRLFITELKYKIKSDEYNYFDLSALIKGKSSYFGGKITPSVIHNGVFRIACDMVDRVGIEQSYLLDSSVNQNSIKEALEDIDINDYYSIFETADILKISNKEVLDKLDSGELKGIMFGNCCIVEKSSINLTLDSEVSNGK